MDKLKNFTSLLLIYTTWVGLVAPIALAQNEIQLTPQQNNQSELIGLQFRVRPSDLQPEKGAVSQPPKAVNLSEADANAIFRRLPPMPSEDLGKAEFQMRSNSLPPPKTGNLILIKFPSDKNQTPPNANNSKNSALEVVRFSPSGNTPLMPDLSVTFSQPMIALSSQEQSVNGKVPVNLTPNVKGRWRWLGTKTLIFDAETRFPMATTFTATIPAGTKSAMGGSLSKEISWTFSTPPMKASFKASISKQKEKRCFLHISKFFVLLN